MEQLSACIADRMIDLNIISSDDKDYPLYNIPCGSGERNPLQDAWLYFS